MSKSDPDKVSRIIDFLKTEFDDIPDELMSLALRIKNNHVIEIDCTFAPTKDKEISAYVNNNA